LLVGLTSNLCCKRISRAQVVEKKVMLQIPLCPFLNTCRFPNCTMKIAMQNKRDTKSFSIRDPPKRILSRGDER
jgi:hypothetical protein